jgi:hypothetical protein
LINSKIKTLSWILTLHLYLTKRLHLKNSSSSCSQTFLNGLTKEIR